MLSFMELFYFFFFIKVSINLNALLLAGQYLVLLKFAKRNNYLNKNSISLSIVGNKVKNVYLIYFLACTNFLEYYI